MANEIRAGLDSDSTTFSPANEVGNDPLEKLSFGKPIRQHVKEFGAIMATACLIIAAFRGYRHNSLGALIAFSAIAAVFAGLGYLAPRALHPVWKAWMKFAHVLSIVMTFVVLSLAWVLGFLPMAGIVRLCGIKVIDKSYRNGALTYWETRDGKYNDFKRLEQQY